MPLLQRLAGVLVAIPLLVAVFVFAWVIFVFVVAGALVLGAWFWWKTRHVRRNMRPHGAGAIIEGEYREVRGEAHAERKLP
jgi:hypothetical protein